MLIWGYFEESPFRIWFSRSHILVNEILLDKITSNVYGEVIWVTEPVDTTGIGSRLFIMKVWPALKYWVSQVVNWYVLWSSSRSVIFFNSHLVFIFPIKLTAFSNWDWTPIDWSLITSPGS